MLRVVLDPNIVVAAALSPQGAPAELLRHWVAGGFELVVSEKLLAELDRALAYPKLRKRIALADARALISLLARAATVALDPDDVPRHSRDPGDDCLLALAEATRSILVSGDNDLLSLADLFPVWTARALVDVLATDQR